MDIYELCSILTDNNNDIIQLLQSILSVLGVIQFTLFLLIIITIVKWLITYFKSFFIL